MDVDVGAMTDQLCRTRSKWRDIDIDIYLVLGPRRCWLLGGEGRGMPKGNTENTSGLGLGLRGLGVRVRVRVRVPVSGGLSYRSIILFF